MLRKTMLFLLLICCFISPIRTFAVDSCAGYDSPGNTYDICYHDDKKTQGNCVWWATKMRPDLNFIHLGRMRNGGEWTWYAEQYGFHVDDEPIEGSVAVFEDLGSWGHVAYVMSVDDENDSFSVSEMGLNWFSGMRENTYSMSETGAKEPSGFIYPTRTIQYQYHQLDGVIILIREDGEMTTDCNDVDRVSAFWIDPLKVVRGESNFVKFGGSFDGDKAIKLCREAVKDFGYRDIDFAEFLRGDTLDSGGSGGGNNSGKKDTYKHLVSLKHFRGAVIREDKPKRKWKRKFTFVEGFTPEKGLDFEVRVQNKYDDPIDDVEAEYYYSVDDEFDLSEDRYLGNDGIGRLKGGETGEEHLRNIDISDLGPGKHYFYVNVLYCPHHESKTLDFSPVTLVLVHEVI